MWAEKGFTGQIYKARENAWYLKSVFILRNTDQ